jgi:hypothetical protein
MSRLIPNAERIIKARKLIQQARDFPVPEDGRGNFSYIAQVKEFLRQARELLKFIPQQPSASDEMKDEVKKIYQEIEQANQEILHK